MSVRIAMVVLTLLFLARYRQVKSQTNNSYIGLDLVDKAGQPARAQTPAWRQTADPRADNCEERVTRWALW
jgi:hypothetical protein